MHVVCSRGSVELGRRCDTLRTSGCVDDVRFSHDAHKWRVVHVYSFGGSRHSLNYILRRLQPDFAQR